MAADLDTSASGMDKLAPEQGLRLMEQCIVCAENPNVVVAPLRSLAAQLGASAPAILSSLASADSAGTGGASEVVTVLKKLPEGERLAYLVGDMSTKVKAMLGLPESFALDGAQPLPALGLDSLMVMELRNVVKQDTGVLLQPDALLNFPTLDGLSGAILSELKLGGSSAISTGHKTVVELTPMAGSSVAPFFCVQGAGRGDFLYSEIAKQLGQNQPFFELRGIGFDFKEVSDLATHFADEIVKLCPEGPLQVGGWSFGGCVAYEIVLQLISRGRQVSRLVLIDWVEKGMATASYDPQTAAFGALVRSVELMSGKELGEKFDADAMKAFNTLSFDGKFDKIVNQLIDGGMLPQEVDREDLASVVKGFEHAIAALLRHEAPPMEQFTGAEVLSVRATKFGFPDMTEFDWAKVAAANPKVTSREIDCDHWEILRKPCVEKLGGFMGDFLGKE